MNAVNPRRSLVALLVFLPVALMLSFAHLHPPTLKSWVVQTEGFEPLNLSVSGQTAVQTLEGEGRQLDAVSLMLPTEGNGLDGTLYLEVHVDGDTAWSESASGEPVARASVDLSDVQDWGTQVFRFDPAVTSSAGRFAIVVTADPHGYVTTGPGDPYPAGELSINGQVSASDLTMRAYEDVGWAGYVRHVSDTSAAHVPIWLLVVALFLSFASFMGAVAGVATLDPSHAATLHRPSSAVTITP